MSKIKVFEAFAGYGSQSIALRNIGVDYEVVAISEIDKYAIQAYETIHGKVNNLGDISKIDVSDIPEHDLFTYSFPCQDLSVAGKQKGIVRGQTRSGLLYECEKIIEHCRPKYLLMENVKNLVGKKFRPQFYEWLRYLKSLGYTNYAQVLNAKDYGIPQNRERVFVVSIYGEHKPYRFPTPMHLTTRISDILEDSIDPKYYINKPFHLVNKAHQAELDIKGHDSNKRVYSPNGVAPTLTTMGGGNQGPKILEHKIVQDVSVRKYDVNGIAPTLTCTGEGDAKKIVQYSKHRTIISNDEEISLPCIAASRGRNPENPSSRVAGEHTEQRLEFNTEGISNTLTTVQKDNYVVEPTYRQPKIMHKEIKIDENILPGVRKNFEREKEEISKSDKDIYQCECKSGWQDNKVGIKVAPTLRASSSHTCVYSDYRIRRLTPRECFRLMGLNDSDIDKIQQSGISNSQQYKLAGNSIVVNVLEGIFKNLFEVK